VSLIFVFFVVLLTLLLASGVVSYFWIAAQLPPAGDLRTRSLHFATTEILDREGNLLWEIIDPTGGRRTTVTLDQVSSYAIQATVATEDRYFYSNVGVDLVAIVRALYYNLTEGEVVSGASTITQQLARNVFLSPQERTEQSLLRKVKEAVLAVEINRRYSKEEILEIYLNQIYYGNLAYGIEAAAQTYFGKPAKELTLAEAAMLAGLPQSPALHDPYVNLAGAKARQAVVLDLMVESGYITQGEAEAAKVEELNFHDLDFAMQAPHFVTYVRQELETIVPPALIYQAGLRVMTTLDPRLQAIAEEEVQTQIDALTGRNVTNGALVAMDVDTGQILAMVGSKNFRDDSIDGQVNMATAPRQPGSTIKPLTYLAAFELLDWTPSTLMMDVPVEYPDGAGGVYRPQNYDNKFHGPVSLRKALANSYNIPAVKTLSLIGVDALKAMAARLGITTLTRNDYGLSLTLGSGEVPLLQMTGAYQAMANEGVLVPPTAILNITDSFGRVIEPARPQPQRVLRPEHTYLMTNILADNEARSDSVGPNSALRLSRPAAAKTGTTNDFYDNWTIGYTPDIVTGVWVGNANHTPMVNVSGLAGAGPIWHNFMERAHEGLPVRDFTRPPTIVEMEVCADSGTIPSSVCPERRKEIFFQEQPPQGPEHDIHQLIGIDLNTGLRANEFCQGNVEMRYYRVYPPDGQEWAMSQGIEQPPTDYCPSTNIIAAITTPLDGVTVRGTLTVEGSAVAANFSHYQIELGVGTNPGAFVVIHGPIYPLP
jgi:1A family penicillin-binding protein